MYGHIRTLAEAEKKGIEAAGGTCTLYQYVLASRIPYNPEKYSLALKDP